MSQRIGMVVGTSTRFKPKGQKFVMVEVNVIAARGIPTYNKFVAGSDPYVIAGPTSRPKELHKTAVIKKTLKPNWDETFAIGFELDSIIPGNIGLNEKIMIEPHSWRSAGNQVIGKPFDIDLSQLKMDEEWDEWHKLQGSSRKQTDLGEVHLIILWYIKDSSDFPEALISHTNNSKFAYTNSLDRTSVKAVTRKGKRGPAPDVGWLKVEVHQAQGLLGLNSDGTSNPYFVVHMGSTRKISYTGASQSSTCAPIYNPPEETGFELVKVTAGKVHDSLIITFWHNLLSSMDKNMGYVSIPLRDLVEDDPPVRAWYDLIQESKTGEIPAGKVEVSLTRGRKKVSELSTKGLDWGAKITTWMCYALACLRRKFAEYGVSLTIGITATMGVVETRLGLIIRATPKDIEDVKAAKIMKEKNEKEAEAARFAAEQSVDAVAAESTNTFNPITEIIKAFKSFVASTIKALDRKIKNTLCEMLKHGLHGMCGVSFMAGFPPMNLELALSADFEMEHWPAGFTQKLTQNYNDQLRSGGRGGMIKPEDNSYGADQFSPPEEEEGEENEGEEEDEEDIYG